MESSKKIVVVGGVAGGLSYALRSRRLDPHAEITVFERGRDVAFSNCCLPYHLSDVVAKSSSLVLVKPETFAGRYRVDTRPRHEVKSINRDAKTVTVHNLVTGEQFDEPYDVLCVSPGARAFVPPIPGADADNVFTLRNVEDIEAIRTAADAASDVVVAGGGFIGLEVAENLRLAGKNVSLVEMQSQVLPRLDADIVQLLHRELHEQGVNLVLSDAIAGIDADGVSLQSGNRIAAQAVILAVGVRPETTLAAAAGLEIGETGGIKVNHNFQTSDPDIYAVGDAVELGHQITGAATMLALAGPAQRAARKAADHTFGRTVRRNGVLGSSVVQVFGLTAASTGLTEQECRASGREFDSIYFIGNDRVGLMPGATPVHLKLHFDLTTGQVLGAQAVAKAGAEKRIDVIATLIRMNGTLEDMADLELCYAPSYATAKDVVNMAALVALNKLQGDVPSVNAAELRSLVEQGAYIIDVREQGEWDAGHIKAAVNVPYSKFREHLAEIPKDQPVYLHCRIGQRSYFMARELIGLGWDNVVNVNGAFLALSNIEYFQDMSTGREPIVDKYNFR